MAQKFHRQKGRLVLGYDLRRLDNKTHRTNALEIKITAKIKTAGNKRRRRRVQTCQNTPPPSGHSHLTPMANHTEEKNKGQYQMQ